MKKQILTALLVMGSLIGGCEGGGNSEAEAPKVNNYTEWASLLQNQPEEANFKHSKVLPDSRTIIGYKGPDGKMQIIVTLPSSYSSNPEGFKASVNSARNGYLIALNENAEHKPKAALCVPNPDEINKEEIQNHFNQFQFVSYIKNGENPVNVPVEVTQVSEGKCWVEFSLIGSGEYIFQAPPQQQ